MIKEGDFVEFTGYQALDGDVETILNVGQKLVVEKVVETEEGMAYNVRPVFADGSIDPDADGDQLFEDEFALTQLEPANEPDAESAEDAKDQTTSKANGTTEPAKEPAMSELQRLGQEYDNDINHDPAILDLIRGTNNITELAYGLYVEHEELYYKLGGLLVDIKTKNIHVQEGYEDTAEGFIEFVKDNIGPKKRTAYYIMSTYKRLREANLTSEDLKGIGWTKARLLKDIKDNDELLEYIEKAKTMTRAELEAELQGRRRENGSEKQRFTFSLQQDVSELVNQALDHAMDEVGDDKNKAFELIILHYLLTEAGVKPVVNGEDESAHEGAQT